MRFGTWAMLTSPETLDILAKHFDFLFLDMEHGNFTDRDILNAMAVARSNGIQAYVRPRKNDAEDIMHVLDSGADGIIAPHISTWEDAAHIRECMEFPPFGKRGYSPYVPAAAYGNLDPDEYAADAGALFCGLIIEDMAGVKNIKSILSKEPDLIYIGVYDLSMELGCGPQDASVRTVFKEVADACKKAGVAVGGIFKTDEDFDFLQKNGVDMAVYQTDTYLFNKAAQEVRKWMGRR